MYNKKKYIPLYLLIFIMIFGVNIDRVMGWQVSENVSSLGNSTTNDCSSSGRYGNCYSLGTGGVRIWLVDSNGNRKSGPIDYWYYSSKLSFFANTGSTIVFNNKKMRQEFSGYDYNDIKNMIKEQEYSSSYSKIFRPIDSSLLNEFTSSYSGGEYTNSSVSVADSLGNTHFNSRVPNSTETIVKRIAADAKNGNVHDYIGEILNDMGADKIAQSSFYLQFEPIIQWQNMYIPSGSCGILSANFVGTISEYAMLEKARYDSGNFLLGSAINTGNGGDFCVFNGVNSGIKSDSSGNYKGNIQIAGIGVGIQGTDAIPPGLSVSGIKYSNFESPRQNEYLSEVGDVSKGYGVSYISLKDYKTGECPTALPKIINSVDNDNSFKNTLNRVKSNDSELSNEYKFEWDSKYNWLLDYKKYGLNNLNELKNYVESRNSCEADCNYLVKKYFGKSKNLTDEVKKLFPKITSKENYYNYEYYTGKIIHSNNLPTGIHVGDTISETLNVDTNKLCEPASCNNKLTDSNYKILSKFFPNKDGLMEDMLEFLPGGKPSCEYETPTCPVKEVTVSCSSNTITNTFTFSDVPLNTDEDYLNKCIKSGIAYNAVEYLDGSIEKKTTKQSSRDTSLGKDATCHETVTLTLPGNITEKTKAGTLLKWGVNLSNDNTFGTMKVERSCYNVSVDYAHYDWAREENIAPTISIYYKEAILPGTSYDAKTYSFVPAITAKNTYYYVYSSSSEKRINDTSLISTPIPSDYENFKIKMGDHTNLHMEFSYDLELNNSLKWYSNNDKNVTENMISESKMTDSLKEKNNYKEIGYGLPTSFLTPSGLKKNEDWYSAVTSSDNDGTGYMYAKISGIGTKNTNGSGHHFDKMLNFAINDDGSKSSVKKLAITYSCGYNIYNELFGYEDGDCIDGKCPTPEGIDVVFRTVELINTDSNDIAGEIDRAFPGQAGDGRTRGRNWIINNDNGEKYTDEEIANILSSAVYSNEPMYHIELDTSLIQRIRQDNKTVRDAKEDPYTYMGKNDGYGYNCEPSRVLRLGMATQKYPFCTSSYLSELINEGIINISSNVSSQRIKLPYPSWK